MRKTSEAPFPKPETRNPQPEARNPKPERFVQGPPPVFAARPYLAEVLAAATAQVKNYAARTHILRVQYRLEFHDSCYSSSKAGARWSVDATLTRFCGILASSMSKSSHIHGHTAGIA